MPVMTSVLLLTKRLKKRIERVKWKDQANIKIRAGISKQIQVGNIPEDGTNYLNDDDAMADNANEDAVQIEKEVENREISGNDIVDEAANDEDMDVYLDN